MSKDFLQYRIITNGSMACWCQGLPSHLHTRVLPVFFCSTVWIPAPGGWRPWSDGPTSHSLCVVSSGGHRMGAACGECRPIQCRRPWGAQGGNWCSHCWTESFAVWCLWGFSVSALICEQDHRTWLTLCMFRRDVMMKIACNKIKY